MPALIVKLVCDVYFNISIQAQVGILRSFDWLIVSRSQVGILCCGRFPAVAKNHWTGEHALLCAWLKWISNGLIYVQALGPLPFMMF